MFKMLVFKKLLRIFIKFLLIFEISLNFFVFFMFSVILIIGDIFWSLVKFTLEQILTHKALCVCVCVCLRFHVRDACFLFFVVVTIGFGCES